MYILPITISKKKEKEKNRNPLIYLEHGLNGIASGRS